MRGSRSDRRGFTLCDAVLFAADGSRVVHFADANSVLDFIHPAWIGVVLTGFHDTIDNFQVDDWTGDDLLVGGYGLSALWSGPGSDMLVARTGPTLFAFMGGYGGAQATVSGFRVGIDHIVLPGFPAGAAAGVAGSAQLLGAIRCSRCLTGPW